MKVKELIEELKKFDGESPVFVYSRHDEYSADAVDAGKISEARNDEDINGIVIEEGE